MKQQEAFDAFYRDTRDRLLVQTFALTGDLGASRRAVRDAFVVAWHHWRKVAAREDPETMARPLAWRHAQRRAAARMWHREKDLDPDVAATLEALGRLTPSQRRALLLVQLAAVSMPQMAREVGLPLEDAENELQTATTRFAMARDVPTPAVRAELDRVSTWLHGRVRWPRATIVRRAGSTRRRTHTTVGAAVAVAALVATGAVVTDTAAGERPRLDRETASSGPADAQVSEGVPVPLPETTLLGAPQLERRLDGRTWTVRRTFDNSTGNGRVLPCQPQGTRYADPRGRAVLVRQFEASATKKQQPLRAVQMTEASRDAQTASRTFRRVSSWFAECDGADVQLLSTDRPRGVGNESVVVALRSHSRPEETWVAAIARTGHYTTTTVLRAADGDDAPALAAGRLAADAVDGLCGLDDAGACVQGDPKLLARDPLPVRPAPAMLAGLDLPRVPGVEEPWTATDPSSDVGDNLAASSCDQTSFTAEVGGARPSRAATRTFVVFDDALPETFGLTETVAALPKKAAGAFLEKVRTQMRTCPDRDLNTDVREITREDDGPRSLSVWRIETEVSDNRTLTFLMAVVRRGTAVAQVGFVPSDSAQSSPADFVALAERASARLGELPGPKG